MKSMSFVFAMLALFLVFGCLEPKWETFTDGKFSMTYPVGTEQQTAGDEVFKTMSQGCQISVSKFGNQPSFSNFVNYIKGMWGNVSGLTIENEYVGSTTADFTVRASDETNQYKGSIRINGCGDNTVYVTMVGCGRSTYDNNKAMVDKIIDSVECS